MELDHLQETSDCLRATRALSRVGDKWSVLTLMQLATGAQRYGSLKRRIAGVSPKMLASTLRELERDGLLARTVHPTNPPSVEYALTELGNELVEPVQGLGAWVLANIERLEEARARYDAENASRAT